MRVYLMDSVPPRDVVRGAPRPLGRRAGLDAEAEVSKLTLAAGDGGLLGEGARLSAPAPVASPQDCGLAGGEYCAIWLGPELPGDQRPDDARSLCFDSEPLAAPLDIVGAPAVRLRLAADRPPRHGRGAPLRRHPGRRLDPHHLRRPQSLPPRWPRATRRRSCREKSSRLRSGSTTSPTMSPRATACASPSPPPTGRWSGLRPRPSRCRSQAAELDLPLLRDGAGLPVAFAEPEGARPWQVETLRAASNSRTRRARSGDRCRHARHRRRFRRGARPGAWPGHRLDGARELDHRSRRPAVGHGETHWTQTLARGSWSVRTETFTRMRSDASEFSPDRPHRGL